MKYAYASDVGNYREENEDTVAVFKVDDIFTVALLLDGMGGARGGKIASETACRAMTTELELSLSLLLLESEIPSKKRVGEVLRSAVEAANRSVWTLAQKDASLKGMGTTLVAAVFYQNNCCVANVGDSRAYYGLEGQLTQITKDQSYLQYLLDNEKIDPAEADSFEEKNIIMSAVGTAREVNCDLYFLTFADMDAEYVLITSDGLHDYVSEGEIEDILFSNDKLSEKVKKLIATANEKGGEDNISAVLVRK